MTIQDAIKKATVTTRKIRRRDWLKHCCAYVENGHVRTEQNGTQTGRPREFSIDDLLADDWEVFEAHFCPICGTRIREDNEL